MYIVDPFCSFGGYKLVFNRNLPVFHIKSSLVFDTQLPESVMAGSDTVTLFFQVSDFSPLGNPETSPDIAGALTCNPNRIMRLCLTFLLSPYIFLVG